MLFSFFLSFFFFNDTATTEIYTLSLHDALPISRAVSARVSCASPRPSSPVERTGCWSGWGSTRHSPRDRKSTRLNSSHSQISYAVFCLKKKKITYISTYVVQQLISVAMLELHV